MLPSVFDALLRGSYSGSTLQIQTMVRSLDLDARANAVNAIVEEKTPLDDWLITNTQTSNHRTFRLLTAWYLGDTGQEGQGFARLKFKTARWLAQHGVNMDLLLEGMTHLSTPARHQLLAVFNQPMWLQWSIGIQPLIPNDEVHRLLMLPLSRQEEHNHNEQLVSTFCPDLYAVLASALNTADWFNAELVYAMTASMDTSNSPLSQPLPSLDTMIHTSSVF